ncbi:MAG: hypothetical protein U0S50_11470 [Sphingopyxis sp.]|uniref:hypothetical protein n=1 Tax=Sphingopyxis sp. TaxID=1908224 RepID=UPI002ABBE123|nr:hypothetical protein [Sphingopyxis sp.]MDZ3832420.1 hypothetical protein [Sphingopyxis sp.]
MAANAAEKLAKLGVTFFAKKFARSPFARASNERSRSENANPVVNHPSESIPNRDSDAQKHAADAIFMRRPPPQT